jgi:hypothetical protein
VNPIEQVTLAWQALERTFQWLHRGRLWIPWLLFAAFEALILAALCGFAHPSVSWMMVPLLTRIAGEEILHYPNVLTHLLPLFARLDGVYAAIAAPIALGAAVMLFANTVHAAPARPADALARAFRRAVPLILSQLPVPLLTAGISWAIGRGLRVRDASGVRGAIFLAAITIVPILARAFFLYAGTRVALEGRGIGEALLDLPRAWARGLAAALFLSFLLALPLFPIPFLCGRAMVLGSPLGPEMVAVLMLGQIALGAGVWFLLSGSITLVHLSLVQDSDS